MLACVYDRPFLPILHRSDSRARTRQYNIRRRTERFLVQVENPIITQTGTYAPTSSPGPRVIHRQLAEDLERMDGGEELTREELALATFRCWKVGRRRTRHSCLALEPELVVF